MSSSAEAIAVAVQHHQAGRLDAAEQIYRQVLSAEPKHADALHLLGVVASQRGQYEVAIDAIRRAIEVNNREPGYYVNLANALGALGRHEEAIRCCERALELQPDFAEAYCNLGNAWKAKGKLSDAIVAYRRALELKPNFPEALSNLGAALRRHGKLDEAIECHQRAVTLMPGLAEAHTNLGNALFETGQIDEAIASFGRALALKPDLAALHNNLGNALRQRGQLSEAVARFRRALELDPRFAQAYSNLGMTYKAQGLLDEAVVSYRRALELAPEMVEAYSNLGNALFGQGELDEAAASYERALAIDPDYADARFSRSFLTLLRGDYERGLSEYEWRWKTKEFRSRALAGPVWDGQRVGTILLHTDQGAGDTIQFTRFARLVKERATKVVLQCPTRLMPLLSSCRGIDDIVSAALPAPEHDAEAYLTSLPGPLGVTLANLPASVPYLQANERLIQAWREKLPGGFRIGVAWQGNPTYQGDAMRSIPLVEFAPLADVPGVTLISLQKGHGAEQVADAHNRFQVVELGPDVDEEHGAFMDTAAIMMNLQLVVTSDTSIAHLAGALGVPVWVALSFMPEWRWLLDRSDSPWYPTMRLFRQKRAGDWASVFEEIKGALGTRLRQ